MNTRCRGVGEGACRAWMCCERGAHGSFVAQDRKAEYAEGFDSVLPPFVHMRLCSRHSAQVTASLLATETEAFYGFSHRVYLSTFLKYLPEHTDVLRR
jgi:hypothetical protein